MTTYISQHKNLFQILGFYCNGSFTACLYGEKLRPETSMFFCRIHYFFTSFFLFIDCSSLSCCTFFPGSSFLLLTSLTACMIEILVFICSKFILWPITLCASDTTPINFPESYSTEVKLISLYVVGTTRYTLKA